MDTKRERRGTKQTHQSGDFPRSLVFALEGGVRAAALGKHFRIHADLSMLCIIVFSTKPHPLPLFPALESGGGLFFCIPYFFFTEIGVELLLKNMQCVFIYVAARISYPRPLLLPKNCPSTGAKPDLLAQILRCSAASVG